MLLSLSDVVDPSADKHTRIFPAREKLAQLADSYLVSRRYRKRLRRGGTRLSPKAKTTGILILAQVACVTVGVWMEHLHISRTTLANLRQSEFVRLASTARTHAEQIQHVESNWSAFAEVAGQPSKLIASDSDRIIFVDSQWRPINPDSTDETGALIGWTPEKSNPTHFENVECGAIELDGIPNFVVAVSLTNGTRLLAMSPQSVVELLASTLDRKQFAVGAVTIAWMCSVLGVVTWLVIGQAHDRLKLNQGDAHSRLLRQTQSLVRTRDAVIVGLAKLADSRDTDTGAHLERISAFSVTLAKALSRNPRYSAQITTGFVRLIGISSALHDIGKVGIPDRILLKRGKLTPDERREMQQHTLIANKCLNEIEHQLGSNNFLQMARQIAMSHHERWDGWGYPQRLKGEQIPLAARIVAIADVYDALSSVRVYKPAYPHMRCLAIMQKEADGYFDPDIFETFIEIESQLEQIARRLGQWRTQDEDSESQATTEHLSELEDVLPEFTRVT